MVRLTPVTCLTEVAASSHLSLALAEDQDRVDTAIVARALLLADCVAVPAGSRVDEAARDGSNTHEELFAGTGVRRRSLQWVSLARHRESIDSDSRLPARALFKTGK